MIVSLHAETKIDGDGTVVLPGLINTHAHLELSALHGAFSDGMPTEILLHAMAVFSKLRDEYNYLGRAGFRLAALNFINAGITTVNTQDIVPERGVDALGGSGLRAFMCPGVGDLLWERSTDAQLDRARSFIDTHHESYDGRIRATIGPFDDIVCTESFWREIATLAAEYPDLLVHTHVLGDDLSDLNAKADHLGGPVDLLEDIGLWNDRLVAAHFRAADERAPDALLARMSVSPTVRCTPTRRPTTPEPGCPCRRSPSTTPPSVSGWTMSTSAIATTSSTQHERPASWPIRSTVPSSSPRSTCCGC